jgi:hypothetical protein
VPGQLQLKAIWAMLDDCAPGYTKRLHTHKYSVKWQGRLYRALPKGEHGSANPPIERGQVLRMVKFFGIVDCARKHFDI